MSYNNNKKNLISVKVTSKGREKIATGNLNLEKWSIGDSEVNYVREDYLIDNNIVNKPSRVLKVVDQQPNLKYYITNESNEIRNQLNTGDISVSKLITYNSTTERGFYLLDNNTTLNNSLLKSTGTFSSNTINNNIINGTYTGISIGDIILLTSQFDTNGHIVYEYYKVINFNSDTITLNRNITKKNYNFYVFFSGDVETVNKWNTPIEFKWNSDVLEYDMQLPINSNFGTKVWNFNIITMENIAGYYGKEETLGYEFLGLMENYLSYNDNLNVDLVSDQTNFCSNELTDGNIDDYQKMIGVIHFTNDNFSNIYGDAFYIDPIRNKNINLKIPNVFHHKFPTNNMVLRAFGDKKYILDSDIEYYDLGYDANNIIGKVLPQFKIFIIDDHELLMAMSIGSGRNFTLPTINSQLTPTVSSEGILPNGKQMYITYTTSHDKPSSVFSKYIHCGNYSKIINSTPTSKDVTISFNVNDLTLFYGQSNSICPIEAFRVIYQITDIGERPNHNNWREINLTSKLSMDDNHARNTEILINLKYDIVFRDSQDSINYDLKTKMLLNNKNGLIGDETFFVGNIIADISSNIYRSIISLNINPNVFTKTTNPTYNDVDGLKPYIAVTEIGIYDKDDDLVMIGKLTKPQNLLNNSTIKIELGLDF